MGSTVCQPSDSCQKASLKIPTLILVETRNAQEGRAEPFKYGEVRTSDIELLFPSSAVGAAIGAVALEPEPQLVEPCHPECSH